MTRNKIRIIRLMEQRPYCHWCGTRVFIIVPKEGEKTPLNQATIDHIYNRRMKKQRHLALMKGKKLGDGAGVYYVLACFGCNTERSKL